MTNQVPIKQSLIPDSPRDMSVDKKGNLSFDVQLSLSSLYQVLQNTISNQGIRPQALTTTQQTDIATFYNTFIGKQLPQNVPNIAGTIAIDYTTSEPIVFVMTFDPATLFVLTALWKTFTIV